MIAFEDLNAHARLESFRMLEETEAVASCQCECCTDRRETAAKLMLYLSGTMQKSRVIVESKAALEQQRDDRRHIHSSVKWGKEKGQDARESISELLLWLGH
jgi:hypothetical protein